jgi:hypothetical protein
MFTGTDETDSSEASRATSHRTGCRRPRPVPGVPADHEHAAPPVSEGYATVTAISPIVEVSRVDLDGVVEVHRSE